MSNRTPGVLRFLQGDSREVITSGGADNGVGIPVKAVTSGDFLKDLRTDGRVRLNGQAFVRFELAWLQEDVVRQADHADIVARIGPITGDGNPLDAWGGGTFTANLSQALRLFDASPDHDIVVFCRDAGISDAGALDGSDASGCGS